MSFMCQSGLLHFISKEITEHARAEEHSGNFFFHKIMHEYLLKGGDEKCIILHLKELSLSSQGLRRKLKDFERLVQRAFDALTRKEVTSSR